MIRREVGESADMLSQNKENIEGVHNGLENVVREATEFFKVAITEISEHTQIITSTEHHTSAAPFTQLPNTSLSPPNTGNRLLLIHICHRKHLPSTYTQQTSTATMSNTGSS